MKIKLKMKFLFKLIYKLIPFKRYLFLFLKIFWKPKENIYRHLYFKQPFKVKIDNKNSFYIYNGTKIENEIFWNGLIGKWEAESIKIWIKLSKMSNTIFDVGANSGVYALVAKTLQPTSKVYAFEPHPKFFKSLQENKKLNNIDISNFNLAVSDTNGKIEIGIIPKKEKKFLCNQ